MAKKLLIIYVFIILLIPNVILCFTEQMSFSASACNVLLPGALILFILSVSRKIGRNIWLLFPYFFLSAFQIVLLKLYGRSIIAVDMFLNLVTTNVTEATELLGNLMPVVGLVIILYLPILILAGIMWYRKIEIERILMHRTRLVSCGMAVAGAIALVVAGTSRHGHDPKDDIFPLNVCYNIYLAVDRTAKTAAYHETSRDFTYNAIPTHPEDTTEIYIAIIGETSRAENWQLFGYDRQTTPLLSARTDLFTAPKTYSESNTTHKSVPMLLSPVSAVDFNEGIYKTKSLITAFNEAGFRTAFISNQRYNHSFIDFFSEEADTTLFIKETGVCDNLDIPEDLWLLSVLDGFIKDGGKKQLIVLHSYGSHFNYRDRYKGMDAQFIPDEYSEASISNREKLVNAYDNTILVTDRLISECIARLDTVAGLLGGVIYTSDHGEDIFDNGKDSFLHASPLPTIYQVHVPMIVWLSKSLSLYNPDADTVLQENMKKTISSSKTYTPTLLMMAGIRSDKINESQSLLSPDFRQTEPVYLDDHNECVALRELL